MKRLLLCLFTMIVMAAVGTADSWRSVVTNSSGRVIRTGIEASAVDHELKDNEYPLDYAFPTNDIKFWKKVGRDWVEMSPVEQVAVVDAEKEDVANDSNWTERERAIIRALVKTINIRLPAGQKITAVELKQAIKEELE